MALLETYLYPFSAKNKIRCTQGRFKLDSDNIGYKYVDVWLDTLTST